LQKNFA